MKKILPIIIIVVIVAAGAFFVGTKIGKGKGGFPTGGPQEFGQANGSGLKNGGRGAGDNFINGKIVAKDDTSITVKLQDGGSKILFYSGTTEISKFTSGSINDLEIGKSIMATGQTNSDGSVTTKTIQMRPEILNQP